MITFIALVPLSETDISNYCKTGRSEGEKRRMGCFQKNGERTKSLSIWVSVKKMNIFTKNFYTLYQISTPLKTQNAKKHKYLSSQNIKRELPIIFTE